MVIVFLSSEGDRRTSHKRMQRREPPTSPLHRDLLGRTTREIVGSTCMGWRRHHRQCRLEGFLGRIHRQRRRQQQHRRHTPTWDQGLEVAGLQAAARRPRLPYCHRPLGGIRVDRVEVEEVALVHLEVQEVGRDSQVVTVQVTLTMVIWLWLMVRTHSSSRQPRGSTDTERGLQCSCIARGCRSTRELAHSLQSGYASTGFCPTSQGRRRRPCILRLCGGSRRSEPSS